MVRKKDENTPKKPRKKPEKVIRPASHQSYTEEFKANALLMVELNNGNVTKTAKFLEMPYDTLVTWVHGKYCNPDVLKKQREKRAEVADLIEGHVLHALDFLPEKLLKANAVQLATVIAIGIDKMQLLRGKSLNQPMTDDQCLNLIAAIVERAKSRRPEQDATSGTPTPESTTGSLVQSTISTNENT